jgi:chaperone modulatory protein CbpM
MMMEYTEEQVLAEVPQLDRAMLVRFVAAEVVIPVQAPSRSAPIFREVDVARLRLACELGDCLELEDDALAVVMGLIDQVHALRADLHAVLSLVDAGPDALRREVQSILYQRHGMTEPEA